MNKWLKYESWTRLIAKLMHENSRWARLLGFFCEALCKHGILCIKIKRNEIKEENKTE